MIRTYQTAKAAGMRIASTRPTEGVLGQISPALRQGQIAETTAPELEAVEPEQPPRPLTEREQHKQEALARKERARERMLKNRG